ncbi:MAG: hypothetical protein HY683_06170 [Chloroflexi bacterium]|nr:hypothetical protein [Chloroflexota bacterium]
MVTTTDTERHGPPAVYIPFPTFRTAVETLGQALPVKLDRSVFPSQSGAVQGQILSAFRFLGLIDKDGAVQSVLKRLVAAHAERNDEQFKIILKEILEVSYSALLALAKQNGSYAQLQEAMRGYSVSGTTLDRAIRFYLAAAKFTGLDVSPHWGSGKKLNKTAPRSRRRRGTPGSELPDDSSSKNLAGKGDTSHGQGSPPKTITLRSGGTVSLSLSVNLWELEGDDRTWVFDLVDKLNKYERQESSQKL